MKWLVLILFIVLPVAVILEGKRQEKKYGRGSGQGGAMMRAGVLGLQAVLEPEKKVEVILEQTEEVAGDEAADDGDPEQT